MDKSKLLSKTCKGCKKEIFYQRRKTPKICPLCGDKYWNKPRDERDLFLLQDEYVESGRDPKILGKIYEKVVLYSENIIKKELNRTGRIISKDSLDDKAQDMAIILIERFLKNPDSIVEHSFGGMLIRISKGVLYSVKTRREDSEFSLEAELEEGFEVKDNVEFFIDDPIAKNDFQDKYSTDAYDEFLKKNVSSLTSEISDLVEGISDRIRTSQGYHKSIYFLIGLKHFLHPSQTVLMEEYYNYCSVQDRRNIENAKLLLRRYLLDRSQY